MRRFQYKHEIILLLIDNNDNPVTFNITNGVKDPALSI